MIWIAFISVLIVVVVFRLTKSSPKSENMGAVDRMDGLEFERFTAQLYANLGYRVEVTKASGDFGADVIAQKNGTVTAIQCKRYKSLVGISAVQEVIGSIAYYGANKGAVITNNYFTDAAQELAQKNSVELIDREKLKKLMQKCNHLEES